MQQPSPDSLRSVLDSVFSGAAYEWRPANETSAALVRYWRALLAWLADMSEANPLLYRILIAGLVVVLVAIIAHAVWLLVRTVRGAAVPSKADVPELASPRRTAEWYFDAADGAASEGRFAEALQLAFVGVSLRLEERGLLRYHPGKTPAECSREARVAGADRDRLRSLVRTLYACAFGGRRCTAEDYAAWRSLAAGEWRAAAH